MGTKYSKVVETFLTCLDRDNADFGDEKEFQDEDGVASALGTSKRWWLSWARLFYKFVTYMSI